MNKASIPFSVIVPCYNSEIHLFQTFSSLASQTFKEFEIIFIDDNSSDNSFSSANRLISELGLNAVILGKPNTIARGVSTSRNYGLGQAKGEWVVFLDSDDEFHPDKLKSIYDYIMANPDAQAIHHAYELFEDGTLKNLGVKILSQEEQNNFFYRLIEQNRICTSTVSVKRTLIQELGGFNPVLQGVEDYFLWLRIAQGTNGWHYLDIPLTRYRVAAQSLMSGRSLVHYVEQNHRLFGEVKKTLELPANLLDRFYRNLFFEVMSYYVSISINTHGYFDFLKGLRCLLLNGHFSSASYFFYKTVRYSFLQRAYRLKYSMGKFFLF